MNKIAINKVFEPCVLLKGWSIEEKVNTPSSFRCEVIDLDYNGDKVEIDLNNGYEIELFNSKGDKLFGGILKTPEASEYSDTIMKYSLSANDYTELANRRLVAASVIDKTAGQIIREVILPILAEDGVTVGTIAEGKTIRKANFNYIHCSAAMGHLQDITGCNWWIDYDKKLHFVPNSEINSPWQLTDDVQHSGFKHTLEHEQYRNIQYLKCGQSRTSVQQGEMLTPAPDGERRIFNTRFPVAQLISMEILSGGVWRLVNSEDIGVEGLNERGTRKWYYAYASKIVSQDDNEIPLSGAEQIRIVYTGLIRVFVKLQNMGGIEERASIEGTSGKYEKLDNEVSIDDSFQATEFASALIKKYGDIDDRMSFDTEVPGLRAGQLLAITKPKFKIENQTFLIESVSISAAGADSLNYSIRAIDGISVGGWETYFAGMLNASKEDEILTDETVVLLHESSDFSSHASTVNITIFKVIFPSNSLFPGGNLFPSSLDTREATLYD